MAAIFALLIFSLAAAGTLLPDRAYSPQENRYLTLKPVLSWEGVRSAAYMGAVEEYATDQFPARDAWVSLKALIQKISGQKENNEVYFAADGYLIGKPQKSPPDIADSNLASVLALKDAGYGVALLVSPMAAEILRDRLPTRAYTPEQAELLDRLRREAADIFVDAGPGLRQADAEGRQVFFRTDHHWTMAGAYTAYAAYMAWLGEGPAPLDSFEETIVSKDFYGTLWSKNSLPGISPDAVGVLTPTARTAPAYAVEYFEGNDSWTVSSVYQREYLDQKDKYAYFLGQNRPLAVIRRQSAAPGPGADDAAAPPRKLMIFKDSYAHCFAPFLLPHFDEIHLADLRYWKKDPVAYMEEQGIRQVLFLYNADDFAGDRSISQIGAYLAMH